MPKRQSAVVPCSGVEGTVEAVYLRVRVAGLACYVPSGIFKRWYAVAAVGLGTFLAPLGMVAADLTARAEGGEFVVAWLTRNLLDAAAQPASLFPAYSVEHSTDLYRWTTTGFVAPARVGGMPATLEFRTPLVGQPRYFRVAELHDFAGADLSGANLSGAKLPRLDLRGANLRSARLERAVLVAANLQGADLQNANLEAADLALANLCQADLTGANLRHANLAEARITRVNLTGADLTGGMVPPWDTNPGVIYRNTTLPDGTRADDSDKWRLMIDVITTGAEGLELRDADLSDLDLSGVELSDAALTRADLRRADLSHADLRRADLSEARLDGASLRHACLRGADLSHASLIGAVLTGADLVDARLPTGGVASGR